MTTLVEEGRGRRPSAVVEPIADEVDRLYMGTGACTLCDCPSFVPSGGGHICGNQDSQGGTCNHWDTEHS